MKQTMTTKQQEKFIAKAREFGFYKYKRENFGEFNSNWEYTIRFQFHIIEIKGHSGLCGGEETFKIIPQKY